METGKKKTGSKSEKSTSDDSKNRQGKSIRKQEKKERLPYGLVGSALLGAVAVAGLMTIALAAPNIVQAVKIFEKRGKKLHRRYYSEAFAREAVKRLARRGMVTIFLRDGETVVRLTEKGRQELLRYQLKERSLKRWRWDGKWRIVIFDIEEKKRHLRDHAREDMRSFGFVKLQESVWVYPYECERVIALLKAQYKMGKELVYIVAGEIENNDWLKKEFGLK